MATLCFEFCSMIKARKAADALKTMGCVRVRLDALDLLNLQNANTDKCPEDSTGDCFNYLFNRWVNNLQDMEHNSLTLSSPHLSGMGSFTDIADTAATRLLVDVDEIMVSRVKEAVAGFFN